MNLYNFIILLALQSVAPTIVYAADVLVAINGSILSTTCTVSSSSKEQTVNMGEWSTSQISNTPPVKFSIDLTDCGDISAGFSIKFTGISDTEDNSLLSLDSASTAKNIALAILDENQTKIPLNESTDNYSISPDANNKISLIFWSKYVATSEKIAPGSANASVTFDISYQ